MRKNTEAFFFVVLLVVTTLDGCVNTELRDRARRKSDYVVRNLHSDSVYTFFSESYFAKTDIVNLASQLKANCEYEKQQSHFLGDFYERDLASNFDKVSFVYDVFLKCDSLRITLKFELHPDPKIIGFKMDPVEW